MYLTMEFGLENESILEKYRKEIRKEYFPNRGRGKARSSRIQRILKEFCLVSAFQEDVLAMYGYQLQMAVEYYRQYDYDYPPFLNNLFKNWKIYLDLLREQGKWEELETEMKDVFNPRFKRTWLYDRLMEIREAPWEKESSSEDPF
jgi:hypothetical protein